MSEKNLREEGLINIAFLSEAGDINQLIKSIENLPTEAEEGFAEENSAHYHWSELRSELKKFLEGKATTVDTEKATTVDTEVVSRLMRRINALKTEKAALQEELAEKSQYIEELESAIASAGGTIKRTVVFENNN